MASRRIVAVLCLLALLALLGGCVALDSPSSDADEPEPDPDPEAVFEGAFVHSDDLEDVSGTVTTKVTDGNRTISETVRMNERPYVDYRDEVLEAPDPDREGDLYISNASGSWWYYPDRQLAQHFEADEPFNSTETRSARADEAERQRELYDLEYQGTERIADRETHVLDIEAKDEAIEEGISLLVGDTEYVYALETIDPEDELDVLEWTIWIDTEFDYPLKEELVYEGPDGEQHVMTEQFETVTFNDGLEDEVFAFEPPENTTVEEL